jgi:hypothetical protein
MARWTVTNGDQVMVIESTDQGLVSVDIPSGSPFVGGADHIRDVRTKLGLAIATVRPQGTGPGGQP